ncbi:MAG: hypothetical protein ACTSRV_12065 [Candidatus Freyarchaeota archaeon]
MAKLTEENIDAEIDRLAEQFKEMASREPQTMLEVYLLGKYARIIRRCSTLSSTPLSSMGLTPL